ncbi:restriction endonuclease [Thermodesulfobacteriota bacterium]
MAGARFATYMRPLIDALRELGNSGTPLEVIDAIATNLQLSDDVLNEQLKSGVSRISSDVRWARFYLVRDGYLSASQRGVWSLTEKGLASDITPEMAQEISRKVHKKHRLEAETRKETTSTDEDEEMAPSGQTLSSSVDYRTELMETLRDLPPDGFERVCQRLLREAGFKEVEVLGKSGDGGIDGKGILQINPLMSIEVLFQCKRYKGSVGSEAIRNFFGAMIGKADKGIFLTTGTFTKEARREALTKGTMSVELVDGESMLDMFEKLELGLNPKTTYEIDTDFFAEFS